MGYDDLDNARKDLNGWKLPAILKDLLGSQKLLKEKIEKDKKGIAFLNNQVAGMVGRDELKLVDEARKKAVQDLGNLQLKYDPLKNAVDKLLNKWNIGDLDLLDDEIKQLDTNNKVRLQIVNKYGVANMKKLDEFIIGVQNERDAEKNKITNARNSFEGVVKRVNKLGTVIFGDTSKKSIRKDMDNVKVALGYVDIDVASDQEDE